MIRAVTSERLDGNFRDCSHRDTGKVYGELFEPRPVLGGTEQTLKKKFSSITYINYMN